MKKFAVLAPAALALALSTGSTPACGGSEEGVGADAAPAAPDAQPVDGCSLLPTGPLWVVEGEELSFQISCASRASLSDLSAANLPEGAVLDTETGAFAWTPALDQAAVYELELRATSLHASSALRIGVADAHSNAANVPIQDRSTYTMELGLPVIFLDPEPQGDADYVATTVIYRGQSLVGEAKRRGKSSLSYPKKSYALRFDKFSPFSETEFAEFDNRTRVILTSTFDDNSYLRQRMAFNLWNQLDPTIKVQAYSAVVYLGTEYRGLYTVTDHVNATLIQRSGLSDTGDLYKAENHDANFRLTAANGSDKGNLAQGYSKTEGNPEQGENGAFNSMIELVSFVATSSDEDFNSGIADLVEIDDYVAWWIHVVFLVASDSAGKNSYHYRDEAIKWRVAPWDFNHSFGQSWKTNRISSNTVPNYFGNNLLFERLLDHPSIGPAILERLDSVLNGPFSVANLQTMLDSYADEIKLSAERDWHRWQDEYRSFSRWSGRDDFTSHAGEVQYIRTWLEDHWQPVRSTYLDQ